MGQLTDTIISRGEIIIPHFLKLSFLALLLSQVLLSGCTSDPQPPDNLKRMAKVAVDRIKSDQHEMGFWLTLDSRHKEFSNSNKVRNLVSVFLPTIIIDLIDPYASQTNLTNELQRAREYLSDQIEDNGLVRYFGRPNQNHFGKGCIMSPDADDTAVVWSVVANPDRSLLPKVLKSLKKYQNEAGFYLTWLAPQHAYQCINPGEDPNPVDIGVQLNLILFFNQFELYEERDELCALVKNNIDNPKLWVWYTHAPLVPVLRESALSQAGCDIRIPTSITSKLFDSQKQWLRLAYLVRNYAIGTPPEENIVKQTLVELAANNFALIEQNPPLLYHQDETAGADYCWSKTLGLALWLRVYWDYISTAHMDNNGK